jgi:CheY-like chemotaxis protein
VTERPKSSREPASARELIVFVIDDDSSMRGALTNLFQSAGLKVEVFGSAPEMLHSKLPDVARLAIVENMAERECYPVTRADLPIKIEFVLRSD